MRLASALEPMEQTMAVVTQSPMLTPGVNGGKRQRAGRRDGLQNTDGRRRALEQERNARAEQEAEHRLAGELIEHIGKALRLRQRADRRRHIEKARKEDAEAHGDRTDGVGLTALDRHDEEDTDDRRERRQRRGLEEIQKRRIRRVHIEQSDDLACDRRADVRAQNNADGLVQRHDASADQARCEHDGRRGALDDRRHAKAEQKSDQRVVRHLFHCALERIGGASLQPVAHQAHTVQEQRKAAKERNDVEDRHNI